MAAEVIRYWEKGYHIASYHIASVYSFCQTVNSLGPDSI